jgi:hypothetical protein
MRNKRRALQSSSRFSSLETRVHVPSSFIASRSEICIHFNFIWPESDQQTMPLYPALIKQFSFPCPPLSFPCTTPDEEDEVVPSDITHEEGSQIPKDDLFTHPVTRLAHEEEAKLLILLIQVHILTVSWWTLIASCLGTQTSSHVGEERRSSSSSSR